jgi:hypothetical protein
MPTTLYAVLATVLMAPLAAVRWAPERAALHFYLEDEDEQVRECIDGGLEVRYRLEYHICRRRTAWFDDCSPKMLTVRTVQLDPVSEHLSISTDRLADALPAEQALESDLEEGLRKARVFVLKSLSRDQLVSAQEAKDQNNYLSIRIRGFCEQNEDSLVNQIPYYLTFGMFRFTGFDSGWVDYRIE